MPAGVDAVTVTTDPVVEHTVWVAAFRAGAVNRATRERIEAGGAGIGIAACLQAGGIRTFATGLLGTPGAAMVDAFLDEAEIPHDFVRVPGLSRTRLRILDEQTAATTDLELPGFDVDEGQLATLEQRVAEASEPGRWVVLADELPPGAPPTTLRRLAEVARGRGALVAVDAAGEPLAEAVAARPDLVKPTREELEALSGRALPTHEAIVGAARELVAGGIALVVVSLGSEGALFVRGRSAAFAAPPPVQVASTAGAGAAMVAGTVAGVVRGFGLEGIASLATAFAAVRLARTIPGIDPGAVERAGRSVAVERLP